MIPRINRRALRSKALLDVTRDLSSVSYRALAKILLMLLQAR